MERQKEIQMRNLTMNEIGYISGGDGEQCNGSTSSVGDQSSLVEDAVAAYEGAIAVAVYVMERVASALS